MDGGQSCRVAPENQPTDHGEPHRGDRHPISWATRVVGFPASSSPEGGRHAADRADRPAQDLRTDAHGNAAGGETGTWSLAIPVVWGTDCGGSGPVAFDRRPDHRRRGGGVALPGTPAPTGTAGGTWLATSRPLPDTSVDPRPGIDRSDAERPISLGSRRSQRLLAQGDPQLEHGRICGWQSCCGDIRSVPGSHGVTPGSSPIPPRY